MMNIIITLSNFLIQVLLQNLIIFSLAKEKTTSNLKFSVFNIVNFISLALFTVIFPQYKLLLILVTNIILIKFVLNKKIFSSIFISALTLFIFSVTEILSALILMKIGNLSFYAISTSKELILVGNSIASVISLVAWRFISTFLPVNRESVLNTHEIKRDNIYFLIILGLLIIPKLLTIIFANYSSETYVILLTILESIILLYAFRKKKVFENLDKQLQLELENSKIHNQTLVTTVDSLRGFKHDMNNMLSTIQGYITLEDYKGLQSYLDKGMGKEVYKMKYLSSLSPDNIKDPGLFNLVANKYFLAQNQGIEMKLEISSALEKEDIGDYTYEFSKIFGILLDNAIEATSNLNTDKKSIFVEIYMDFSRNAKCIHISNKFKQNDKDNITVDNCFKEGFSTKKVKSGFGLYEVKKIINNINIFELNTLINKETFDQYLYIYNKLEAEKHFINIDMDKVLKHT